MCIPVGHPPCMWRWSVIVIAFALGSQAADLSATGPSYTTVYVDQNGYIVGVNAMGPVTPHIGGYGEPFRLDMLPHGAMSFGSIRAAPNRSPPRAGLYGRNERIGY